MDKNTSIDRAALSAWRFNDTNGFVVKDYSGISDEQPDPLIMVVRSSEIFEVIADASANQKKIAIYAIGPCVYDAS